MSAGTRRAPGPGCGPAATGAGPPRIARLPLPVGGVELGAGAGDEVPPHEDRPGERLAAEQQHLAQLSRPCGGISGPPGPPRRVVPAVHRERLRWASGSDGRVLARISRHRSRHLLRGGESYALEQRLGDLAVAAAVGDQGKRLPVPRGQAELVEARQMASRAGCGSRPGTGVGEGVWKSARPACRQAGMRSQAIDPSCRRTGPAEQHHDAPPLVHSSPPLLAAYSPPLPAAAGLG